MDRNLSDDVADQLETLILEGAIEQGARLDETRLAERFSVSRTPIREALQRLTNSGLVEHRPRRGAFVRQPDAVELVQMFEFMGEMEGTAGRLAALRISDAALETLARINARCNDAVAAGDSDLYYSENETFHAAIYSQSGNAFVEAECLRMQRRLRPYRRMQLRFRGRLKQSMDEHERIVAALAAGDGDEAARLLRAHVSVQGEKFHALMASMRLAAE
ncbi:Putative L-lactate dehydrogenase operon regulatory protein [Roseivivax sp. THAF40]|uniref:GntR family transcriptional regulator n=1 Tax=unclassified Roseivivax TaxID=2639302 RepID=UPI001267BDE1|nr:MULTISPECIES: GntR family transcriptional regulator [unclassified Roseivivax]QFS83257.1 Putative L-lactate dehydrogenase operon regulatory protein [Roseivivax sp. THAF197b]QFT47001.1 Putative L-lactate dehydrogenase operon regulatory protein [Roseivivax sp. THAF40]